MSNGTKEANHEERRETLVKLQGEIEALRQELKKIKEQIKQEIQTITRQDAALDF